MGRPRRKPSKIADNHTDQDEKDQDEKLVDLLEKVLECSGIWSTDQDHESAWGSLSSSLGTLAKQLKQTVGLSATDSSTSNYNEERLLDPFLDMEQTMQEVRMQADLLLSQNQSLSTELGVCRELEGLFVASTRLARLRPLVGSLRASFKRRRWLVKEAVETIHNTVSKIYSSEASDDIIKELRQLSNLIRRRCLDMKEYPFKDVINMIELLSMDDDYYNMDIPNSFIKSIDKTMPIEPIVGETTLDPSEHGLPPSIGNVVQAFLGGDDNGSGSHPRILLVGPEGSGKTYYCNKIALLVQGHAKGKCFEIE
jgi:hypothetical protein